MDKNIEFNQAVVFKIAKLIDDLEEYQPQIRDRKNGFLDMSDQVDKIRDREYHLLWSLLK